MSPEPAREKAVTSAGSILASLALCAAWVAGLAMGHRRPGPRVAAAPAGPADPVRAGPAGLAGPTQVSPAAAVPAAPPAAIAPSTNGESADSMHLRFYGVYRNYIQHEDDLINNRLNWNFTIQGFLFAAFTLTTHKIAELKAGAAAKIAAAKPAADQIQRLLAHTPPGTNELRMIVFVLAGVGLLVSLLVFLSVFAAHTALRAVETQWKQYALVVQAEDRVKSGRYLPGVSAGGDPLAQNLGIAAPLFLPLVFVAGWMLLLAHSLAGLLAGV